MGATSWRYYTAFDPDAAMALKRLREDVFARGDYVDLTGSTEDQLRATMSGGGCRILRGNGIVRKNRVAAELREP